MITRFDARLDLPTAERAEVPAGANPVTNQLQAMAKTSPASLMLAMA